MTFYDATLESNAFAHSIIFANAMGGLLVIHLQMLTIKRWVA
jgi:hypothetical protein